MTLAVTFCQQWGLGEELHGLFADQIMANMEQVKSDNNTQASTKRAPPPQMPDDSLTNGSFNYRNAMAPEAAALQNF